MVCPASGSAIDMADRKAELEKKRKKLEELKRAREQNKLQTKDKEVKCWPAGSQKLCLFVNE